MSKNDPDLRIRDLQIVAAVLGSIVGAAYAISFAVDHKDNIVGLVGPLWDLVTWAWPRLAFGLLCYFFYTAWSRLGEIKELLVRIERHTRDTEVNTREIGEAEDYPKDFAAAYAAAEKARKDRGEGKLR